MRVNDETDEALCVRLAAAGTAPEGLRALAREGPVTARAAVAMLAAAADVPLSVVDRAGLLRSAKGLVSLVWEAGFSMRVAGPLQAMLAHLAPSAILPAGSGGSFPLAAEEMRWQVDFLKRMGRQYPGSSIVRSTTASAQPARRPCG